ncbi:MAG: DedA family protein [Candidatus Nanosalina sp.]
MIVDPATIVAIIQQYGVLAVVIGVLIEEILVPIPSPIIPMAAGMLLVTAETMPAALVQIIFLIVIPASIASVLSSYFVYAIAYYGGKPAIERYGKYLDVEWGEVEQLEEKFVGGNEKYYIALLRAVPIVPLSLVSGASGLFRVDWKTYGIWSFYGMVFRTFSLALLGWFLRDSVIAVAEQISSVSRLVMVLAVILGLGWVLQKNAKRFYMEFIDRV